MQVRLAGYNLDKQLIDKLDEGSAATPETISAAYARISRSSKSVTELRSQASADVAKARSSNWEIVFEMGHASVAEHAVFNFDLIGVSRYLSEFIQRSRLASFTEKSQRYVTLDGDYVLPAEIGSSPFREEFTKLIEKAFTLYAELFAELKIKKATERDWDSKRALEGAAKEDARYVLPLCTRTQMGMTINARSFELLLRRLCSVPLQEAQELYQKLYAEVKDIAPSLIRFINTDDFTYKKLRSEYDAKIEAGTYNQVNLLSATAEADTEILTGLLFEQQGGSYQRLRLKVAALSEAELNAIWDEFYAGIKPWHKMPRAFEMAEFTFELTMSASCFAQFKRHRMCTILKAPYNPKESYVIPPSIQKLPQLNTIPEFLKQAELLAGKLNEINPLLAPYVLTNAHRVRVLAKMNLRELYHFTRLRSDEHAQWEIRNLAQSMTVKVKELCPFSARWLMGKSEFPQ
ncbi:MAG TPA: FAD-dependent thymidylate synthase [Candidatus Cloacimonadota bacterium]|mgnify:CR=1 FL=1|nr:FAD-dependent thymidylate synthase [Candidatus Cloacimonadota bacterium]HQL15117.1 FAD-dependent thymidylate synthase [Candidatus Cloacimonadota bacterium]